ncbi:hypothetical protein GWK47_019418 [Chionoecetes opilio]|uniref:K Homology domain-containing protein n=1 Tax=Chionoecetes opilio TaxID=41210 RepID=A0A8J4XU36_CHIOP|nr:hypothetical protein GWK47_019418 [Chionoecetes opilio]
MLSEIERRLTNGTVGRIIGKGGQNVRDLQRQTGSVIKLPRQGSTTSEDPTVHIVGPFFSVQVGEQRPEGGRKTTGARGRCLTLKSAERTMTRALRAFRTKKRNLFGKSHLCPAAHQSDHTDVRALHQRRRQHRASQSGSADATDAPVRSRPPGGAHRRHHHPSHIPKRRRHWSLRPAALPHFDLACLLVLLSGARAGWASRHSESGWPEAGVREVGEVWQGCADARKGQRSRLESLVTYGTALPSLTLYACALECLERPSLHTTSAPPHLRPSHLCTPPPRPPTSDPAISVHHLRAPTPQTQPSLHTTSAPPHLRPSHLRTPPPCPPPQTQPSPHTTSALPHLRPSHLCTPPPRPSTSDPAISAHHLRAPPPQTQPSPHTTSAPPHLRPDKDTAEETNTLQGINSPNSRQNNVTVEAGPCSPSQLCVPAVRQLGWRRLCPPSRTPTHATSQLGLPPVRVARVSVPQCISTTPDDITCMSVYACASMHMYIRVYTLPRTPCLHAETAVLPRCCDLPRGTQITKKGSMENSVQETEMPKRKVQ